jgi:hypothetical protein
MYKFEDPFASISSAASSLHEDHRSSSQHSFLSPLRGSSELLDPPKTDRASPRELYYNIGILEGSQLIKHSLVKIQDDCSLISFALSDSSSWRGRVNTERYRVPDSLVHVLRLRLKGWIEFISAYGVAIDKSRITSIMSADRGDDSFSVVVDHKGTIKPMWCRLCCTEHAKNAASSLQRMIWKKRIGDIEFVNFEEFEAIVVHYGIIQAQIFNQQGGFKKSLKPANSPNMDYFHAVVIDGQILFFEKRFKYEEILSSANAVLIFPLCKGTVCEEVKDSPLEIEFSNKALQTRLVMRASNAEEAKIWKQAIQVDKALRKMSISDDFVGGMNFDFARSRKTSRASLASTMLASTMKISLSSEDKTNSSIVPIEKLPIGLTCTVHEFSYHHLVLKELESKGMQPPVYKTKYVRVSFPNDFASSDTKIEANIEYLSETNEILSKSSITSNYCTEVFQDWPEALAIKPNKSVNLPICTFFCCSFHKEQIRSFIESVVVALKQENSENRAKLVSKIQHFSKIVQNGQIQLFYPKHSLKATQKTIALNLFNGRLAFWDKSKYSSNNILNVISFCEGTKLKYNFESLRFLIYQENSFSFLFSCYNELFFKDWIERMAQQLEGESLNIEEFDIILSERAIQSSDNRTVHLKFQNFSEAGLFLSTNALSWQVFSLTQSSPNLNSFVLINRPGKKLFKTTSSNLSNLKAAQFVSSTESFSESKKPELETVSLLVSTQSELEASHTNPLELVHLERGRFGPQDSIELCCSYHAKYALILHKNYKAFISGACLNTDRLCLMKGEIDLKHGHKRSSWTSKYAYLLDGMVYCFESVNSERSDDIIPLCCGTIVSAESYEDFFALSHPAGLEWTIKLSNLNLRNRWLAAIEIDLNLREMNSCFQDPQVLSVNNLGSLKNLIVNGQRKFADLNSIGAMFARLKVFTKVHPLSKFRSEIPIDEINDETSDSSSFRNRTRSVSKSHSDLEKSPTSFPISKHAHGNSFDFSSNAHQNIDGFIDHLKKHDNFFNFFYRNFRCKTILLQNMLAISEVSKGLDFGSLKSKLFKETENLLFDHQTYASRIFTMLTNCILCCKDEFKNPNHMNISM